MSWSTGCCASSVARAMMGAPDMTTGTRRSAGRVVRGNHLGRPIATFSQQRVFSQGAGTHAASFMTR